MKKMLFRFTIVTLASVIVLIACKKSLKDVMNNRGDLSVERAKDWYDANKPKFIELKSGNIGKTIIVAKPDWDKAEKSENEKIELVEGRLKTLGNFLYSNEETYNSWNSLKKPGLVMSVSKLVVMKDKKTKAINSFVMTMIADKKYLEKNPKKLGENSYFSKDNDYSGYVLFNELNGKFTNGWKLTDGIVTHKVTMNITNEPPLLLKSTVCSTFNIYGYYQICTTSYWSSMGELNSITTCDAPYWELAGTYTQCVEVGGGTDPNYIPQSDPNLPCLGDPIKNPTICPSSSGRVTGGMFGCVRIDNVNPNCQDSIFNRKHDGLDIETPVDMDIYAMYSGIVTAYEDRFSPGEYRASSYGNYVTIRHTNGDGTTFDVKYNHLNTVNVSSGDNILPRQIIGKSGNTGNAAAQGVTPHVHIQVFTNAVSIDPINYMATQFNNAGAVISLCN
jgi:hypothetical protein